MLKGKVAIVTGAGRGIGKAIAEKLASEGAKLILNYRSSIVSIEELVKDLRIAGTEVIPVCADISLEEDAKRLIETANTEFGRIDILVNNAGITKDGLMLRMTEEQFSSVIDTNLKGSFFCMKYASQYMMKQREGRIVNMSSIVGISGNAGQINYAASKAGLLGMTKSAAKELAGRNITVNAVAPGFIRTDMTEGLKDSIKEACIANIPLKRFGEVKEVAEAVCFLVSDAARYITGQVLQVDGGMLM